MLKGKVTIDFQYDKVLRSDRNGKDGVPFPNGHVAAGARRQTEAM